MLVLYLEMSFIQKCFCCRMANVLNAASLSLLCFCSLSEQNSYCDGVRVCSNVCRSLSTTFCFSLHGTSAFQLLITPDTLTVFLNPLSFLSLLCAQCYFTTDSSLFLSIYSSSRCSRAANSVSRSTPAPLFLYQTVFVLSNFCFEFKNNLISFLLQMQGLNLCFL